MTTTTTRTRFDYEPPISYDTPLTLPDGRRITVADFVDFVIAWLPLEQRGRVDLAGGAEFCSMLGRLIDTRTRSVGGTLHALLDVSAAEDRSFWGD